MRKTRNRGMALAIVVVGMSVIVGAQGPRRGMPPGGPGGPGAVPPGLMRINLTDQQKTDLRTLVEQDRGSRQAEVQQMRELRQQLNAAVFGGADQQQLSDLTAQLADLQRQALEADVALQVKIAALLTDEQRRQILTARPPQ